MKRTWIPIYIDPTGLRVAVLGGGQLGERRAKMFADAGAQVRVYALRFADSLKKYAYRYRIELVKTDLLKESNLLEAIKWADLVVIATGVDVIDRKAAAYAREMRKLVNNGVDAERGNVIVPFQGETSYGLKFAVTSLGETGIAARIARDRIKECLEDQSLATMYRVMARIKKYMKTNIKDAKQRLPLYFIIEEDKVFQRYVSQGEEEKAFQRALEIISNHFSYPDRE
ncbi:MAG: bifunctional precorrin-2 dehydrogenase/sirohydrochlorin ferrochelatase [Desulfurococcales archaeon]|nr:bifunctional precorrin-2 dehydrogenase/sirohydrochlorin ferrochelatase [Desulfurococcales archaeon]